MNSIEIYIRNVYDNFQIHINNNRRILFSGQYGIGKTYFLKEFFEDMKHQYNVFHLFLVNYQISQNEDIFENIKFDILNHILLKGWLFSDEEQDKIGKTLALQVYAVNNAPRIVQNLLKVFTLGKVEDALTIVTQLEDIGNKFTKYHKEINENRDLMKVKEYMEVFDEKIGSIYEFDSISQLIYELLENNKKKATEKENVLIIDDLERIDPEHIFRILNIFSAHFDQNNEDENKFGFDKIIFVCDINNLRHIFSSKYGIYTDFNGYINKFFSSSIYYFDNKEEIKNTVKNYIYERLSNKEKINKHFRAETIQDTIINLLEIFIDSDVISIRHLKNIEKYDFIEHYGREMSNFWSASPFFTLIKFLYVVYNKDYSKLVFALSNLRINRIKNSYYTFDTSWFLKFLIPLLNYNEQIEIGIDYNKQEPYIFKDSELNIAVLYNLSDSNFGSTVYAEIKYIDYYEIDRNQIEAIKNSLTNKIPIESKRYVSEFDIFEMFKKAIHVLDRNNLLR